MKLLLDETVYELTADLITSWLKMTPELNNRMIDLWKGYLKEKGIRGSLHFEELLVLGDSFIVDRHDDYYQLIIDVATDMKKTMGNDEFQSYAIDMTPEELEEYSKQQAPEQVYSVSHPVKIDVESA